MELLRNGPDVESTSRLVGWVLEDGLKVDTVYVVLEDVIVVGPARLLLLVVEVRIEDVADIRRPAEV